MPDSLKNTIFLDPPNNSFTFLIHQTFLGEKPKNACPEYELSSLILSLQGP